MMLLFAYGIIMCRVASNECFIRAQSSELDVVNIGKDRFRIFKCACSSDSDGRSDKIHSGGAGRESLDQLRPVARLYGLVAGF